MLVADGEVEIRYVIPTDPSSESVRFCHLRSDYFHGPARIAGLRPTPPPLRPGPRRRRPLVDEQAPALEEPVHGLAVDRHALAPQQLPQTAVAEGGVALDEVGHAAG